MNYFGEDFSPLFSDLCGLCVFAGDNPSFGCGVAALRLRGEYSSTSMILHGPPFDFQKTLQPAGRLRGFHLVVGAARTQERIHFSLR
jgi:hypothetical protein